MLRTHEHESLLIFEFWKFCVPVPEFLKEGLLEGVAAFAMGSMELGFLFCRRPMGLAKFTVFPISLSFSEKKINEYIQKD